MSSQEYYSKEGGQGQPRGYGGEPSAGSGSYYGPQQPQRAYGGEGGYGSQQPEYGYGRPEGASYQQGGYYGQPGPQYGQPPPQQSQTRSGASNFCLGLCAAVAACCCLVCSSQIFSDGIQSKADRLQSKHSAES
ncbi:hypothetical protein V1525DRAFT_419838 [Lipomyces kononenkoae]|uniref:Uncharacterized protein n=1 Tax=Lipomyces kononenkoae TaxID=34357 RepID=A0ACC3T097_LIPKO